MGISLGVAHLLRINEIIVGPETKRGERGTTDPPSEERSLEPIQENIDPTRGEVSSDEEYVDCLNVFPHDRIVDGFFY